MSTRDRLLGLAVVVGGGLIAAVTQLRVVLWVTVVVLALVLRRTPTSGRVVIGFVLVLVAVAVGSLPVVDPVNHKPEDFHSEALVVQSIAVLKEEILIRAAGNGRRHVLVVTNTPERSRALQTLHGGDVVRAWFIEQNGYLWQLARGTEFLVRLVDRDREKQAEIEAILLYPCLGLGVLGLVLLFVSSKTPPN